MALELQKLFGHNVRLLREAQGLTQEELARKAGINRSYLGGVERGQRTICMDNIAKIAQALYLKHQTSGLSSTLSKSGGIRKRVSQAFEQRLGNYHNVAFGA